MRVFGKSFITSVSALAAITCAYPTVAAASPIYSQHYSVKNGDSFWKIAHQYQIPVSSLIEANPTDQIFNLQIGSVLVLPGFATSNHDNQAATSAASTSTETSTQNATKVDPSIVSSTTSTNQASAQDLYWMAHVIHAEAGGESLNAQIAVGDTVLHRMESSSRFKTVHDVVFDIENGHYQFTCVSNGFINTTPTQSAVEAANRVLNEHIDLVPGATVFYNPNQTPVTSWVWRQDPIKTIGDLVFAK